MNEFHSVSRKNKEQKVIMKIVSWKEPETIRRRREGCCTCWHCVIPTSKWIEINFGIRGLLWISCDHREGSNTISEPSRAKKKFRRRSRNRAKANRLISSSRLFPSVAVEHSFSAYHQKVYQHNYPVNNITIAVASKSDSVRLKRN